MAIKIVGIHHHAVRINDDNQPLDAVHDFYTTALGLNHDEGRPEMGVPGWWINVGEGGQIHLIGGPDPSPYAKGPGKDPAAPHVALAVEDIVAARKHLEDLGVDFWTLEGVAGPDAQQLFVNDPCGNVIELHQYDNCRCEAANRKD